MKETLEEESKQNALNHFLSTSDVIIKDSQKFDYKNTVLPKEEPKSIIEKMKSLQKQWQKDMDKSLKETIEEAAENHAKYNFDSLSVDIETSFISGAKWQAERMYSEEDMILYADYVANCRLLETYQILNPKEWFKQFKKI